VICAWPGSAPKPSAVESALLCRTRGFDSLRFMSSVPDLTPEETGAAIVMGGIVLVNLANALGRRHHR